MVYDLHCDLLAYLAAHPYHFAYNDECRVSIPQLLAGGVSLQTLAIFTATDRQSVTKGMAQARTYQRLSTRYPDYFASYQSVQSAPIKTVFAIENGSSFCSEGESLQKGVDRFQKISEEIATPLYVSLTWHTENRFGGGNHTEIGLKEDGKELLRLLEGKLYAIDFSHTSDALAEDILNFLDQEKLSYKLLASHSNLRGQHECERNLPDEIADEIVRRGGVIGLSVVSRFIGKQIEEIIGHVAYGLKRGYENHLALGADFFFENSVPMNFRGGPSFFTGYDNASCYPQLRQLLQGHFDKKVLDKLFSGNCKQFLDQFSTSF